MNTLEADIKTLEEAARLRDNEDYIGAIALYSELITKYPRANLFHNRGTAYSEMGDFGSAVLDLTRSIDLDATDSESYVNRGNAYFRLGNFTAAIADFNKSLELLAPSVAFALNGRASVYMRNGDDEAAIADFKLSLEVDKSYAAPCRNLAKLLRKLDREEEALFYLNGAEDRDAVQDID